MTAVWDTTLASRLHRQGAILDHVADQAAQGTPVRVAAPAILEIACGCQRMVDGDTRYRELLAWFTRLLAADAVAVVAFDGDAALVAGRLRGVLPHPPGGRDHRSKTMRQASWLLDIEIAATAFAAGLDIATENRRDFEALGDALAALFPGAPELAVVDGPLQPARSGPRQHRDLALGHLGEHAVHPRAQLRVARAQAVEHDRQRLADLGA